jgi:DNA polymerase III epsilon subunit-like protein
MQKRKFSSEPTPLHSTENITTTITNRYVLVIDTETTGLPSSRSSPASNYKNWDSARLVQVAWELFNPEQVCIQKEVHIVIPNGFTIPNVVVNIHGITTERALQEGLPLEDILKKIALLLEYNPIIVAHNIAFDNDIILAELYRSIDTCTVSTMTEYITNIIMKWAKCEKHCTMKMGTLPGERWPKLIALYERCFNRLPEGDMHRADNDVRACAEIYYHLMKIK